MRFVMFARRDFCPFPPCLHGFTADVEFSADDLMSILLHVMACGVDKHTTAAIIADLDYIQKFHFVPMTQSVLGYGSATPSSLLPPYPPSLLRRGSTCDLA